MARIAKLQAELIALRAKLAESEKVRIAALEDGLRLSQENEVLRRELAALKPARRPAAGQNA